MMRAFNDPMGGTDPLIDKAIGNAYDTVALVAKNIALIQFLGENMDELTLIAKGLKTTTYVETVAGQIGELVSTVLPTSIKVADIKSFTVMLRDSTGNLFAGDSGLFNARIEAGAAKVALMPAAPPSLIGSTVVWSIVQGN